jgi:hypothetical protein
VGYLPADHVKQIYFLLNQWYLASDDKTSKRFD